MKKSIAVLALVVFLAAFIGVSLALAEKGTPPLTCEIEYFFKADLGIFDPEGRLLAWVGPISGDIEGVIKWWVLPESPPPKSPPTGQVMHGLLRWEIWDEAEEVLLLAGDERERSVFRHGKNSVWRGNGIVTEASAEYEAYIGSRMHDGGNVTWDPETGYHGSGTFRVAGSSSKAAPGRQRTGKSATSWGNIKAGK